MLNTQCWYNCSAAETRSLWLWMGNSCTWLNFLYAALKVVNLQMVQMFFFVLFFNLQIYELTGLTCSLWRLTSLGRVRMTSCCYLWERTSLSSHPGEPRPSQTWQRKNFQSPHLPSFQEVWECRVSHFYFLKWIFKSVRHLNMVILLKQLWSPVIFPSIPHRNLVRCFRKFLFLPPATFYVSKANLPWGYCQCLSGWSFIVTPHMKWE